MTNKKELLKKFKQNFKTLSDDNDNLLSSSGSIIEKINKYKINNITDETNQKITFFKEKIKEIGRIYNKSEIDKESYHTFNKIIPFFGKALLDRYGDTDIEDFIVTTLHEYSVINEKDIDSNNIESITEINGIKIYNDYVGEKVNIKVYDSFFLPIDKVCSIELKLDIIKQQYFLVVNIFNNDRNTNKEIIKQIKSILEQNENKEYRKFLEDETTEDLDDEFYDSYVITDLKILGTLDSIFNKEKLTIIDNEIGKKVDEMFDFDFVKKEEEIIKIINKLKE